MSSLGLPSKAALVLALLLASSGCTTGRATAPAPGLAGPGEGHWASTLAMDHPLVGAVYDVEAGAFLSLDELERRLEDSPLVLLGEQHPNVDHHRLQARILGGLVENGRRPAVVFEQFDVEDQGAMDAALEAAAGDSVAGRATALARATAWTESGWPPFDDYRPLVEQALEAGLPIRAGNLSRERMRSLRAPDVGSGDPVLGAAARASLTAEIRESHCGYANDAMVEAMVAAQRSRDRTMADVLLEALAARPARRDGAVLIAGFGHVRRDYGVPLYLAGKAPRQEIVSVALVEVLDGRTTPSACAEAFHREDLPFDYVLFTPRSDDEDPCEKFRASLERMKSRHGAASSPPAAED